MQNKGTPVKDNTNTTTNVEFVKRPSFNMYHAKKEGNGAASRWEYDKKKNSLFLTMANQTGVNENKNGTFGWRKYDKATQSWIGEHQSVSMALNATDIAEILQVLYGRKPKTGTEKNGIYHQNSNGSSTLNLSVFEDKGKFVCYMLEVANKTNEEKEYYKVRHSISLAEAEILRLHLEKAVLKMLNW